MQAGNLRKRITLQVRSTTRDAANEPLHTWSDLMTLWADVQPMAGRKLEIAQAINSEATHQITTRYVAGVTTDHRAVYQGRYFNIHSVIDVDSRHREMHMLASEGLNDG